MSDDAGSSHSREPQCSALGVTVTGVLQSARCPWGHAVSPLCVLSPVSHWGRCKSEGRGGEKPEPRARGVRQGDIKVGTWVSESLAIAVIIGERGRQRKEETMMRRGEGVRVCVCLFECVETLSDGRPSHSGLDVSPFSTVYLDCGEVTKPCGMFRAPHPDPCKCLDLALAHHLTFSPRDETEEGSHEGECREVWNKKRQLLEGPLGLI
ncbi:unnamed protein product [Pleuronectes platessa]|uniref:Uncharacterized protein n=1 Tax=Pleuronectes platessa TaxID=8262 RepID=A0A9N7Y878_PLEPL|nr:unnamed protein product [Pleuronectes platessa]